MSADGQEANVRDLVRQNAKLKEQVKFLSSIDDTKAAALQKYDSVRLAAMCQKLRTALTTTQKEKEDRDADLEEAVMAKADLMQDLAESDQRTEEAEATVANLRLHITALEESNQQLQLKLGDMTRGDQSDVALGAKVRSLTQDCDGLKSKLAEVMYENTERSRLLEQKDIMLRNMQGQVKQSDAQVTEARAGMDAAQKRYQELAREHSIMQEEHGEMERELHRSWDQARGAMAGQGIEIQLTLETMKNAMEQLTNEKDVLYLENQNLQSVVDQLQAEQGSQDSSLTSQVEAQEEMEAVLMEMREAAEAERAKHAQELRAMEAKYKLAQVKLEEAKEFSAKIEESVCTLRQEKLSQADWLQNVTESQTRLKEELTTSEATLQTAKAEINDWMQKVEQAESRTKEVEEINARLGQDVVQSARELQKLKDKNNLLQAERMSMDDELAKANEKMESMGQFLNEADAKNQASQKELSTLKYVDSNLQKELVKAYAERDALKAECASARSQVDTLRTRIVTIQAKNQQLQKLKASARTKSKPTPAPTATRNGASPAPSTSTVPKPSSTSSTPASSPARSAPVSTHNAPSSHELATTSPAADKTPSSHELAKTSPAATAAAAAAQPPPSATSATLPASTVLQSHTSTTASTLIASTGPSTTIATPILRPDQGRPPATNSAPSGPSGAAVAPASTLAPKVLSTTKPTTLPPSPAKAAAAPTMPPATSINATATTASTTVTPTTVTAAAAPVDPPTPNRPEPPKEPHLVTVDVPPGPMGVKLSKVQPITVLQIMTLPDGSPSPLDGAVLPGDYLHAFNGELCQNVSLKVFQRKVVASGNTNRRLTFRRDVQALFETEHTSAPTPH